MKTILTKICQTVLILFIASTSIFAQFGTDGSLNYEGDGNPSGCAAPNDNPTLGWMVNANGAIGFNFTRDPSTGNIGFSYRIWDVFDQHSWGFHLYFYQENTDGCRFVGYTLAVNPSCTTCNCTTGTSALTCSGDVLTGQWDNLINPKDFCEGAEIKMAVRIWMDDERRIVTGSTCANNPYNDIIGYFGCSGQTFTLGGVPKANKDGDTADFLDVSLNSATHTADQACTFTGTAAKTWELAVTPTSQTVTNCNSTMAFTVNAKAYCNSNNQGTLWNNTGRGSRIPIEVDIIASTTCGAPSAITQGCIQPAGIGHTSTAQSLSQSVTLSCDCGPGSFAYSVLMRQRTPHATNNFSNVTSSGILSGLPTLTAGGTITVSGSTGCSCALPVELVSFTGQKSGRNNILNWTTATEMNNSHFALERSNDGVRFTEIGKLPSKALNGNSSEEIRYNFVDDNAPSFGTSYYRLNQIDLDGRSEYSNIIHINRFKSFKEFDIKPMPVKDNFTLTFQSETAQKGMTVKVLDLAGRTLVSRAVDVVSGENSFVLDTEALSAGMYLVSLENGNEVATKKMVKTK